MIAQDDMSQVPLVSVLTPFYNTEAYLAESIESVLKQTYQNWEYILVNNCSTDRSLEIANSYAQKDSRIRVHSNVRFAVNQACNYNGALRLISPQSKYCKIVQADDWIFPDCLAEMVRVAESHPSAGIVGSYRLDDVRVNCDGLPYPSTLVSGKEICRLSLLQNLFVFGSPTTVMFQSDIVRSRVPFYNELSRHEDTEACYEILQAHDFGFVHKVLSFTRRENESITTWLRLYDPSYLLDKYISILKYGKFYLNESEYKSCLENHRARYYRFIGERFWSKGRREFLEHHAEGLQHAGHHLHMPSVYKFAFIALIGILLDVKRVARYLLRINGDLKT